MVRGAKWGRLMQVRVLTREEAILFWPDTQRFLRSKAGEFINDRHDEDSLLDLVDKRMLQVWFVGEPVKFVMLSQVATFPRMRVLQVVWAAGELEGKEGAISEMLDLAAIAAGADMVEMVAGRAGWERHLKQWGFEFSSLVLWRPVGVVRAR